MVREREWKIERGRVCTFYYTGLELTHCTFSPILLARIQLFSHISLASRQKKRNRFAEQVSSQSLFPGLTKHKENCRLQAQLKGVCICGQSESRTGLFSSIVLGKTLPGWKHCKRHIPDGDCSPFSISTSWGMETKMRVKCNTLASCL